MDNVCVSMETIGRAKDVVDHACHMKNFAMENVSASMDAIEGNVVYFNACNMKNIVKSVISENVNASMDLIEACHVKNATMEDA